MKKYKYKGLDLTCSPPIKVYETVDIGSIRIEADEIISTANKYDRHSGTFDDRYFITVPNDSDYKKLISGYVDH